MALVVGHHLFEQLVEQVERIGRLSLLGRGLGRLGGGSDGCLCHVVLLRCCVWCNGALRRVLRHLGGLRRRHVGALAHAHQRQLLLLVVLVERFVVLGQGWFGRCACVGAERIDIAGRGVAVLIAAGLVLLLLMMVIVFGVGVGGG